MLSQVGMRVEGVWRHTVFTTVVPRGRGQPKIWYAAEENFANLSRASYVEVATARASMGVAKPTYVWERTARPTESREKRILREEGRDEGGHEKGEKTTTRAKV